MASGWRQELIEETGRNSTIGERRAAKNAYVSKKAVDTRMGEGTYDKLRAEAEQEQFGSKGYESGTRGEQRRFNRRFNRNLRNDKLQPRPTTKPVTKTNPASTKIIYPAFWGIYNIKPRGFQFNPQFSNLGIGTGTGTGNNPESKPKPKTDAEWDAIATEKLRKPSTMQDVMALQKQLGITVDGKWGDETQAAYDAYQQNQPSYRIYKPAVQIDDKSYQPQANSSDVANIQRNLGLSVTGIWDDSTTEAVKKWQRENGLEQTGMWDQATTNAYDVFQKDKEMQRQSQLRTRFGFADENAVKEWQIANGLEGTGQLDQSSIGKWNELSRLKAGSNTQSNPFVGEKSYMTEQDARYAFANLYNKHLGDKGLSRENYFSNTGYSNATKELDGYDEAWNQFISQYNNHGYPGIFGTRYTLKEKFGGKMNKIKYFQRGASVVNDTIQTGPKRAILGIKPYLQQGGTMNQQQNIQQQVIQLVQAAMQGDQKATDTVNQIMQAAQQGDQQAVQLAQMIQQVVEQMKGQAVSAKWGSKLRYIKSLKYANGGKTCLECQRGGNISTTSNNSLKKPLKKSVNKVEEKACGGKTKKLKK